MNSLTKFADKSRDLYDIYEPVHMFTKIFGYAPQTYKRSTKRLTKSGIIYAITLITVKCTLIYTSLDPSKFTKVTNNEILNYGLWIQTEISLLLSLWFLLLGLSKTSNKWLSFEKFYEVDEILKKEFHVHMRHIDFKLWSILTLSMGVFHALMLFGLTIYFMTDLPLPSSLHKACVCFSIYISNICLFATTTMFMNYGAILLIRFQTVNNILRQLLLDDSYLDHTIIDESKEFIYTNYKPMDVQKNFSCTKKSKISSIYMSEWMQRRKNIIAGDQQTPSICHFASLTDFATKTFISKATFYKSGETSYILEKITILIGLHDKLTDCVVIVNNLFSLEVFFLLLLIFIYDIFGSFSSFMVYMDYQLAACKIASLNACWILCYMLVTLTILSISTFVTKRAKDTAVIVHRIIRKTKDSSIQKKLFRFSNILYSRNVTFHFGLVVFNWPFLLTVNGAIASYLVILIQFQLNNKRQPSNA